jgi:hypothetical protein
MRDEHPQAQLLVCCDRPGSLPTEGDAGPPDVTYALAPTLADQIDHLKRLPRPQLILDRSDRRRAARVRSLRHLFYFVAEGGCYLVEELQAAGQPRWDDKRGENTMDVIHQLVTLQAARSEGRILPRRFGVGGREPVRDHWSIGTATRARSPLLQAQRVGGQ